MFFIHRPTLDINWTGLTNMLDIPGLKVKMDLDVVHKARVLDEWLKLKDVPSGSVHLRLEWLSLLSSADRLSEVIQRNRNMTCKTADPPSAAILSVYLDRAQDLPRKKGNKDPSPMVQLSVQDTTKESRICYLTSDPVWEDAFTFYIQDPRKQELDIQVIHLNISILSLVC
uniref:Extended synaptotagmin-like protein 1a n=1 Tax=Hucho hucho TaxID=62062 RepID=A0A4W5RJH8_9TELE